MNNHLRKWLTVLLVFSLPAFSAADQRNLVEGSFEPKAWNSSVLEREPGWYASAEARAAADTVMSYQSTFGAWPKNTNLLERITPEAMEKLQSGGRANTIDNDATTVPM